MRIVNISDIIIPPNRQRKEFDQEKLNELAESIRTHGLFHPIVVSQEGDKYRLVAGERRLRAITQLAELDIGFMHGQTFCQPGQLPCTLLSELDDLTLRKIELEENVIRVDLTWQERVRAIAELDAIYRSQSPNHTAKDTAIEIYGYGAGSSIEAVQTAIELSKHLDDPEIASARSQSEAKKIMIRKLEAKHREMLAASFNDRDTHHTILHGDAHELMKQLPSEKFHCIITDPPYGIRANEFGSQPELDHDYDDSVEYSNECYRLLAVEGFRVASREAHLYTFCDHSRFPAIAEMLTTAGWKVWPRPIIWWKGTSVGMLPRPEYGPRYTYETILFASKGDKKVTKVAPDVIAINLLLDKIHAAEKPVDLYVDLLSRSCYPGDYVLDPFAGSGTIFSAADEMKLIATGIEINSEYVNACKSRIKGGVL